MQESFTKTNTIDRDLDASSLNKGGGGGVIVVEPLPVREKYLVRWKKSTGDGNAIGG
jgi:hypothetical protein